MKLIIDSAIPYIRDIFEPNAKVVYKKGVDITNDDVKDCDGMIIRTRTKCNEQLLKDSNVKFIGTATIGYDHIDQDYCSKMGINVKTASGCNARGVVQYIIAALISLCIKYDITPTNTIIGIIGVGNVGGALEKALSKMGFKVLVNDPIRAEKESNFVSTPLKELLSESNIVTLHTPLTLEGEYKTYQMADSLFFDNMGRGKIFINASRGEVVCEEALITAMKKGIVKDSVIDVWCNEPNISQELCNRAYISTPHIAGYSIQGKANGTAIMVKEISKFFGISELSNWYPENVNRDTMNNEISFEEVRCRMPKYYNIMIDNMRLKSAMDSFEDLRNNYKYREEFF